MGEFNQCSSQLRQLYTIFGIPGSEDEFTAYRILYMIHTRNKNEMVHLIGSITNPGPNVQHALALRSALSKGDFCAFFFLARETPDMGSYLIDQFIDRERVFTFLKLAKAFRPTLPVRFIGEKLGFFHAGEDLGVSMKNLEFWISELEVPIDNHAEIDCKNAVKILSQAKIAIGNKGVDIKGQIH